MMEEGGVPPKPLSIYIHIPFCEVKCGYCDFFSVPRGYEDFDLQREYVSKLVLEIGEIGEIDRQAHFQGRPLQSIFFGGGTPSLLDPDLIEKILKTLSQFFSWNQGTEITLETNPKTVSLEKLRAFRSLGINRISLGVQSFQDRFLQAMGRIHSGAEAKKTLEDVKKAGFENVSLDLIYALPGQSFEDWQRDLEEAITRETPHLSAYHLTLEKGTAFESLYRKGALRLPPEEEGIRCLTWTRERLYPVHMEAYEISNFSRPGFESVHNRNYWLYGEYLGFGTAAASFIKEVPPGRVARVKVSDGGLIPPEKPLRSDRTRLFGTRRTNVRDLKKYLSGQWEGFSEEIKLPTAMGEYCMLGLRTREGIVRQDFKELFGADLQEIHSQAIARGLQRGWMEATPEGWRLNTQGILFADEAAMAFL